jgi:Zn-dependent protease with chaperone function
MHARAIAPALAILLLLTTLPVQPGALAQTAAPPAQAGTTQPSPAAAPPAPADATAPPTAAAAQSQPAGRPALPAGSQASAAPDVPPMTIGDEKLFAQSAQATIETQQEFGIYDNPGLLARVNRIGYELAQHNGFAKFPITFHLINQAEPNAGALPGGHIMVTRGMLDLGLDDDMMACMLGHEMGHVIKEHYLHMAHRAMLMSILGNLLTAGMLISSARSSVKPGIAPYDPRYGYDYGDGNRVQGAAIASLVASELMLRSYSREQEDEADLVGQDLAAAAGYDPDGARRLWETMESRSPQIRQYGYLQSHPFSQERMHAAEARKMELTIQRREPADLYRQRTQDELVAFAAKQRVKEATDARKHPPRPVRAGQEDPKPVSSVSEFVYQDALNVWPRGKMADSIRLARLHQLRDTKLAACRDYSHDAPAEPPAQQTPTGGAGGHRGPQGGGGGAGGGSQVPYFRVARASAAANCAPELHDYGAVERAYRKELAEMSTLDPTGPAPALAPLLNREIAELEVERKALYPHAVEIFNGGVFETPFLVAYLSNFPDVPEVPQVALALGDAYSRTGNEAEAVSQYMTAWKAAPDSPFGKRARAGLRNLTGTLKQLAALQELATQDQDLEMKKMAGERLASVAHTYDDVVIGAEYLRRFPDGEFVVPVLDRLNVLADNLYGEVVLYQGFGDITKASDRINKILINAPLSPAAEKLRDRALMIAESEKNG